MRKNVALVGTQHRPLLAHLNDHWWSLTPYDGCEYRCVYCSSSAQGVSRPRLAPDRLLESLQSELAQIAMTDAITVGALSDAYPTIEEEYRLTLRCLLELIKQRRGFDIVTKGTGILRDAAMLARYADKCAVFVSLCTLRDDVARRLERSAPSATDRLRLVRELKEAGVQVRVCVAPWIPGITDAARLLEHIPPGVPVQFAPLNVCWVRGSLAGRHFTQEEVNKRYLDEFATLPRQGHVSWVAPVEPGAQLNCLRFL